MLKISTEVHRKGEKAWECFIAVVHGFLGNNKADNYKELVGALVESFGEMDCRISLKGHVLPAHPDNFKGSMGTYSEEQGEHFHQDIMKFEQRYQGSFHENMMRGFIRGSHEKVICCIQTNQEKLFICNPKKLSSELLK